MKLARPVQCTDSPSVALLSSDAENG